MVQRLMIFCIAFFALFSSASNAFSKNKHLPKHVILIGYDGLSSDCIREGADMPVLRKMMREGAYTLERRSVLPSVSACNWASMFMGAGPELHGYTEWGSRVPELPSRVVNDDNRFYNKCITFDGRNHESDKIIRSVPSVLGILIICKSYDKQD